MVYAIGLFLLADMRHGYFSALSGLLGNKDLSYLEFILAVLHGYRYIYVNHCQT